jgi:hypothetical protein
MRDHGRESHPVNGYDRGKRPMPIAIMLICGSLCPASSWAQAWLPDKGEFNTVFVVADVLNKEHYLPDGEEIDVGHTRSTTYAFAMNYGLTDRVMLSASLPYVITKYWGPPSHGGAPGLRVDDGDEHGSLTDLRVGVHYQLLEDPVALAPFIAYVTPVTDDYYVQGHAAQGRGLDELLIGFSLGKSFDPWIPRTYAQVRYTFGFVEEVADIEHDRENVNLEIGTFLTPRWSLSAYGQWQWTHGGIDVPIPQSDPLFPYHDRLAADEYFNVGVGTGWSVTRDLTLFAIYMEGVRGENGHKINQGVTVGVSYGFRPRAEGVGVAGN